MKSTKFKEKQYFNDKIVFIILGAGVIGALFCLLKAFVWGPLTLGYISTCLVAAAGLGAVIWWLRHLKLKVSVNDEGIKYKMSPIHGKAKTISWNEVESYEVVRSPKAAQWHGSNISFGGEAFFSLTGRNGLSIDTKDGRHLFIGCQDVDRLKNVLKRVSF